MIDFERKKRTEDLIKEKQERISKIQNEVDGFILKLIKKHNLLSFELLMLLNNSAYKELSTQAGKVIENVVTQELAIKNKIMDTNMNNIKKH